MSKYDPLRHHLERLGPADWPAGFSEIEAILGFPLPASARRYPAWWANDAAGHSHARAWLDAGWRTANVDVAGRKVVFRRTAAPRGFAEPEAAAYRIDRPVGPKSPHVEGNILTIVGLDDATILRLRTKAELSGRTIETVARDVLTESARLSPDEKRALSERIRALTPPGFDVDVTELIRQDRDSR